MLDDFSKDMLMLGGTVIGFIATVLTLLEKLLEVKARFTSLTSKKERKSPSPTGFFSSKPIRGVSYLLLYETSVIVAAGLLLNYIGLTLSRHLESILFLDMTGTALVAFLLGPWWGAIVAFLSNSVVNWLLYPETGGMWSFSPGRWSTSPVRSIGAGWLGSSAFRPLSGQGVIPPCPMVGSCISLGSAARSS